MIPLERHIEILLLSHDCVIVPGFGGFVAHHSSAYYDESSCELLPPYRTLGFNPSIQMNDSLLVQSYIDTYDLSYPEALKRIEGEVKEIRQILENEGRYEMNDIGTISVNAEGNIEFSPCEAGLLTPSLYGLSTVEIKSLEAAKETVVVPVQKVAEVKEEEAADDEPEDETQRSVNVRLSVIRNIAAACIAIVAYLLMPKQITGNGSSAALNSEVSVDMLSKIMPSEPAAKPAAKTIELKAKAEPKAEAPAPAKQEEAAEAKAEPFYAVVVASHVSKKNASRYAEELRQRGFDDAMPLLKSKHAKVIVGHFATEEEGNQLRRKMSNKEEFAQSWVMKVNP